MAVWEAISSIQYRVYLKKSHILDISENELRIRIATATSAMIRLYMIWRSTNIGLKKRYKHSKVKHIEDFQK